MIHDDTMYMSSFNALLSLALVFLQGQIMQHEQVTSYSAKQEGISCPNYFAKILDDGFKCKITELNKGLSCLVFWLGFSSWGQDLRVTQAYIPSKITSL